MNGWVTQGPKVAEFERAFAELHGTRHAVAVSNCTTALHLILSALGVGPGDEVLVPAFTWVSTANAVVYCGAKPVLVDVDPRTFNMDPSLVAEKVTSRTRAVMPVHLFGLCADINAIAEAAPGIPVVCDAACAVGSSCRSVPAGAMGRASAFSFHPRKVVTTGEGGMITTDDGDLAESVRRLRNHGASVSEEQRHLGPKPYLLPEFDVLGYNYRMTDLQGALGLVQLGRLDAMLAERREKAKWYGSQLSGIEWITAPGLVEGHGWQAYVCMVDEQKAPMPRNDIMEYLLEAGISTRPGTHAVHMLGYYARAFGFRPQDFPGARNCHEKSLALPLHNRMRFADYEHVVQILKELDKPGSRSRIRAGETRLCAE
jgi:dTDP-4-amino-4,6-dideoxygalactose transaminase